MGAIKTLDEAWAVIKRDYQRIRELEAEVERLKEENATLQWFKTDHAVLTAQFLQLARKEG